jgi:ribonuclease HI
MQGKRRLIQRLTNRDWGNKAASMKQLYSATSESILRYSSAAWQPWISSSNFDAIEREQEAAARVITGLPRTTNEEALWAESGLVKARDMGRQLTVEAYEKSMRLSLDNPRRKIAELEIPTRYKRKRGWREQSRNAAHAILGVDYTREEFNSVRLKPWLQANNVKIHTELLHPVDKTMKEEACQNIKETLAERGTHQTMVFTDGSAERGTHNGGAAVVVIQDGKEITSIRKASGQLCSSYSSEMLAINEALTWLSTNEVTSAMVLSDSQSSLRALKSLTHNGSDVLRHQAREQLLNWRPDHKLTLQWIPSHVGFEGNERADVEANKAREENQSDINLQWGPARAAVKRACRVKYLDTHRGKMVYDHTQLPEKTTNTRKEEVLLAQLRAGHCPRTKYWRGRFLNSEDTQCDDCGEEESKDHVWECPALAAKRRKQFDEDVCGPEVARCATKALGYLRDVRPEWF